MAVRAKISWVNTCVTVMEIRQAKTVTSQVCNCVTFLALAEIKSKVQDQTYIFLVQTYHLSLCCGR